MKKLTDEEWDKMGFSLKERYKQNYWSSWIFYLLGIYTMLKGLGFLYIDNQIGTLLLFAGVFSVLASLILDVMRKKLIEKLYLKTFYKRRK